MDHLALEVLAPMIIAVVLTLTVGGVILLKPLSNRLADLLAIMADERKDPTVTKDLGHIHQQLDTVSSRLALLEERQDFHEKLLESPDRMARRQETSGGAE